MQRPGHPPFRRSWARHPLTVATVAVFDDWQVPLIRQYRVAIDAMNLEVPGGLLDADDPSPEVAAARELREEVGVAAGEVAALGSFLNSPGHCSQRTLLFLARDLTLVDRQPDGVEEIGADVEMVDLRETSRLVAEGIVQDAKTIIGLFLAATALGPAL